MAASDEQLRQAYSDRIVGLPRREYSSEAIASRKKFIEEAYVILSDPNERKEYDRVYLTHAYNPEKTGDSGVAVEERTVDSKTDVKSTTLGIDISQDELIGALLLLQELGEYEQVLKLGRPYLVSKNGKVAGNLSESSKEAQLSPEQTAQRPDVVLTVALACLELGREQWQQAHYENAAVSLETGLELLSNEELFQSVQAEIEADLHRLRPYRILELLALPMEKTAERQQGLRLLHEALDQRSGIDGTGLDNSGLNVDDFLRFIQQLRHYLTVAEQHKLFEQESKRPSAVATYLAVYALIARGFTQRQPALIRQAKQMLIQLGKRQDVHLEQSLCALLLGQTQEATRALELSQEYEALAFIRENSQDSPDLLPGLCLYGEEWLQNELFPHFRDLKNQPASLKEYFADTQVQAYLEALPRENHQSTRHNQQDQPNSNVVYRSFNNHRQTPPGYSPKTTADAVSKPTNSVKPINETPTPAAPRTTPEPFTNRDRTPNSSTRTTTAIPTEANSHRKRKRSNTPNPQRAVEGTTRTPRLRRRNAPNNLQKRSRLILLALGSLSGLLVLWLLVSAGVGLLQNIFFRESDLQAEQLNIQINKSVIEIPEPNSPTVVDSGTLTKSAAEGIVNTWLSTKKTALGPDHEIESLNNILVGTSLASWQIVARQDKANNRYRTFEHSVKVESVDTVPNNQNQAAIEAIVTEQANFYENGQVNEQKFYNETLRVRYMVVKIDGNWRIKDMSVVNKVS